MTGIWEEAGKPKTVCWSAYAEVGPDMVIQTVVSVVESNGDDVLVRRKGGQVSSAVANLERPARDEDQHRTRAIIPTRSIGRGEDVDLQAIFALRHRRVVVERLRDFGSSSNGCNIVSTCVSNTSERIRFPYSC